VKCGVCGYSDDKIKPGDKCPECGNKAHWLMSEEMFWSELGKKMRK
jgi:predicted Zn-ribbon and HTH transcriptional regulator